MTRWRWAAAAVLAGTTPAWAAERFTRQQLEARFWYDLGPAEVDVSGYPERQRADYPVFKATCSQCHTPARPLNAPLSARKDWKRFIDRMHVRSRSRAGAVMTDAVKKAVVEFLVYDAQIRKVKGKEAFEAKSRELQTLFEEVRKERLRLADEEGRRKAQPAPPYTGVR